MQPLFRLCLLLLIALCLPLAGWANAAASMQAPCPMMAEMANMAGVEANGTKHDCCADAATMAKTGSPCKAGQECKSGSVGQASMLLGFNPIQNTSPLISTQADRQATAEPSGVWRPPRSV